MMKSPISAALAALVLATGLAAPHAMAQRAGSPVMVPPQAAGSTVALLDLAYVFKNHARFKSRMGDMKTDVQRAEAWVKKEREAIRKIADGLKDFRTGTQEYKQLEQQLAKRQADVQVQLQLQRKDFLQQEAKIYHDVYNEILQQVEHIARQHGYVMVLRFNGDRVNRDNPEDVLRDINKSVIWFDNRRDITGLVLEQLNKQRGGARVSDGRSGIPTPPPRR